MNRNTEFYVPVDGWDVAPDGRLARYCGGGGSPPTQTTNTQVNYSPEEQAQRALVQSEAAKIYAQSPSSTPNPGPEIAPFSADTIAAQNYMRAAAIPVAQNVGNMQQGIQFGLSDIVNGKDPTLDRAIEASVRPITQAYTDPGGVLSQQRTEMNNNNMLGSTRDVMMQGIMGGRYMDAVGDTAAKLAAASRTDTLNTFAKTLGLAPSVSQAATQPAQMLSAVGNQNELLQQAQLDKEAQDRLWGINYPWMNLNNYANIVYGGANPGTTSTNSGGATQGRSATMGVLGGAAAGASMGAMAGPWGAVAGAVIGGMMGAMS